MVLCPADILEVHTDGLWDLVTLTLLPLTLLLLLEAFPELLELVLELLFVVFVATNDQQGLLLGLFYLLLHIDFFFRR